MPRATRSSVRLSGSPAPSVAKAAIEIRAVSPKRSAGNGDARMTGPTIALWRRLDVPGHDACSLQRGEQGWTLEGTATFLHRSGPACLRYRIECDAQWRSVRGSVRGWMGGRSVAADVASPVAGTWSLDGVEVPGLDDCLDLDLGFTPATNFLQLRRIALRVGDRADFPVAWLDDDVTSLTRLPQRYRREGERWYAYESPSTGYAARLVVGPDDFVRDYPGLWAREE